MTTAYLIHLANYSDGVLYVLAFLLLVALAVILDRFWYLRRTILLGETLVRRVAAQGELHRSSLEELRTAAGRLPEAALLDAAVRHVDVARGEAMAGRLDEAIMLIAPRLDKRLWVLDTVVTLAPLLGLFGTIIGMFHAFSVLATPGHAPTEVTGGVADALVATASGIFIAMIGLAAFNMLNNQVRMVIHQLDSIKLMVMNRTDGVGVVPLVGPRAAQRSELRSVAAGA
jgi:biopolymer transport protein ExbB